MIKPSDIIRATGSNPEKPVSAGNPLGTGHCLYVGRIFKCAGLLGPNPRFDEDTAAGFNPPTQVLIQHVIMTLVDVPPDGKANGVVPTERADEATWDIDAAQTSMAPLNPVCQVCGQPPVI